uniref:Response regulatory domain-containing protein n=1 Tax=Ananas comosus var. bracteatus TaxID=296719 RepID=A0A6V7QAW5_ANACO|nr:unnamed protein product [Ananas comosus var. bracteatus]
MAVDAEAQFHVLAVDDSLIDRKLIERLLKHSSYQVTTVDSGSKALELLGLRDGVDVGDQADPPSASPDHQEIEVNLIITDYCMPGMTGYDLLKRIKGSSSLKDIPVVIMSSENVPARIDRCLEGGAEEFLLKPVQLSDMKRLKPHLLKGKPKEQNQNQKRNQEENDNSSSSNSDNNSNNNNSNSNDNSSSSTGSSSSNSNSNSNSGSKRKAMDEGLSPERRRPRLTVP